MESLLSSSIHQSQNTLVHNLNLHAYGFKRILKSISIPRNVNSHGHEKVRKVSK